MSLQSIPTSQGSFFVTQTVSCNACRIADGDKACLPCVEFIEDQAQIEETLQEKLPRTRQLRDKVNHLHDPIIGRLPYEIAVTIFEFAATPYQRRPLRDGEIYEPLQLGWVCRSWRQITYGMPQLWTFMSARIRRPNDLDERLEIAERWLKLSGDYLPISVYFRIHEDYPEDHKTWILVFRPFIHLLNTYSHRWKHLCGIIPPYLLPYLSVNGQGAPHLETLQLTALGFSDLTLSTDPVRLLQPRSLQLFKINFHPEIGVKWAHVIQLKIDNLVISIFLNLLPHLSGLKDLWVYGVIGDRDEYQSVAHVTLQELHVDSFEPLDNQAKQELLQFLDALILPSLRHLAVNFMFDAEMFNIVTPFIQRPSSASLSSLSLSFVPSCRRPLKTLLRSITQIKELEVTTLSKNDSYVLDVILHFMKLSQQIPNGPQPFPLPNLESFKFSAVS